MTIAFIHQLPAGFIIVWSGVAGNFTSLRAHPTYERAVEIAKSCKAKQIQPSPDNIRYTIVPED